MHTHIAPIMCHRPRLLMQVERRLPMADRDTSSCLTYDGGWGSVMRH